jgi:Proteins of 100 residues with WXG.
MADYIKVDAHKMRRDIEALRQLLEEIPQQIDELEGSMAKLSTLWEGQAWDAFQRQVVADIEYLREVYRMGKEYVESFSEAKRIYQDVEIKVDDEVRGLKLLIF